MSLSGNVDALATRVATEVKAVRSETHPYLGPSGGDDTSALNTFLTTYAGETAQMPRLAGTYTITGTVTIKGNLNGTEATFNYTGSGTAVQVGTGGAGVRIDRCRVSLPRVSCANKPGTGWVASTVGVRVVNAQSCIIDVLRVVGFETGLSLYGEGQGVVYCIINLGHLENNKRNLVTGADTTGWVNQNTFIGGRFSHASGEGLNVTGTRHVLLTTSSSLPNNNLFSNCSLESAGIVEEMIECHGLYNIWLSCRFENGAYASVVHWGAESSNNQILYGYAATSLTEVHTAGAGYNSIMHSRGARVMVSGNGQVLENSASSASPVLTVMDAGATAAGTSPATGWKQQFAANTWSLKAAADANPRIQMVAATGRLYLGNGTVTPAVYIYATASTILAAGPLSFSADNTYDFGGASLRPRYVRVGTAVQTGTFTTAGRPTAAAAGAGAMIFDTTLNKPTWSTGSVWVDATGATV